MDEQRIHPETIETGRFVLRELSLEDAAEIYSYTSDPEVTRYVFFDAHKDVNQTVAYIASFNHPNKVGWSMVQRHTKRVVGIVFLHSIDEVVDSAELAYNVTRDLWGRGYATEASRDVIDHYFSETTLSRIDGVCMIEH